MSCVCGHPGEDHGEVVMSVPLLPNGAPLYPITEFAHYVQNIANTRPGATYERHECWCGCGEYLCDMEGW